MSQIQTTIKSGCYTRAIPQESGMELATMLNIDQVIVILQEILAGSQKRIDNCTLGHIRFRPGASCSINYRIMFTDLVSGVTSEKNLHALVMTRERYLSLLNRFTNTELQPGSLFNGITKLEKLNTIFFAFPLDPKLPHLEILNSGKKLADMVVKLMSNITPEKWQPLSRQPVIDILRYKPGSRLVCSYKNYWEIKGQSEVKEYSLILRFERPERLSDLISRTAIVSANLAGEEKVGIANPLFILDEFGLIGFEKLDGLKLSELLRLKDGHKAVKRAGESLAILHGSCVSFNNREILPAKFRDVDTSINLLKLTNDIINKQVINVSKRLSVLEKNTGIEIMGLVHGDFHQGQILFGEDVTWFIDIDCAGLGDINADLGNFIAQLRMLSLKGKIPKSKLLEEEFLRAYHRKSGRDINFKSVVCWIVHGLLELAAKEFRRLKPGWPENVEMILAECQTLLSEVE